MAASKGNRLLLNLEVKSVERVGRPKLDLYVGEGADRQVMREGV